ncbi:MAG: acyl-CoA reductase [Verrucomicrobiota bacterium]
MKLPNYFLADLPPEATLSPALLSDACATLKHNRESYLLQRSTKDIIRVLTEVAAGWLEPENQFRQLALEHGPAQLGFSCATLERGLDKFFRQFTADNFQALLEQELGEARRLDDVVASETERAGDRAATATGPEFLVHIAAGNIPNPTLMSMVLGLLTRSGQFVKCASGTALLPRLFAHSIYELQPKLATCLEVAEWRGGNEVLEAALFAEADCVTATGSDEALLAIRNRLSPRVRFLGYGHRVSFGYVAGEVLTNLHAKKIIARAADDVVAWDQLGCLSPHVIYVQSGGAVSPVQFAEQLAEELARREAIEPRGKLTPEVAATIASRRAIYQVRAAHSSDTHLWHSKDSTAWTVVCEADARFPISCLYRFIYVKPVSNLAEVIQSADVVRRQVSTVGVAVPEHQAGQFAAQLARWGATRVCPLGQMQNPPLTWRHDGRSALGDLVTWTDFES